ncbi:MAG: DUF115 domain-containing protein [Gammaproteobacteria bacterium]|nr:DUF115 domain-containing protein [Gammaproteobacteria bacterium]
MQTLPFLVNAFGDRYLYDVNRGSFNQIGAANLFRQRFGEGLFAEDSLTIVVGSDSGLLLRHVAQRGVPDGSRFLFVELPALLPTIAAEVDTESLDDNCLLTDNDDLSAMLKDIRFGDYANIGNVRLIESLAATDDFFGEYRALYNTIQQQLDSILWVHNVQLSNPSFVSRQLENLIEQHVPAAVLRGAFAGKTAVLLGGGPSLDELLPWIERHQDRLVIIAVSRICRRLQQAGVTPHIVASIDPTELSFDISKEFLQLDPRVVLAHANHVSFPLLAQWRGRSVFLDRRFPWAGKNEPDNIGAAGPTVTNTAFGLAKVMGFSTIVFAGIDLCHSIEGYSHARGSNEFDAGPALANAHMRIETNSGRWARTTPDFFNATKGFTAQALDAQRLGIRVVNPAPGAAKIAGVEHVAVDDIRLDPLTDSPFDTLHDLVPSDDPIRRRENLRMMQRELARAHKGLRTIIKLAEEALACNDGLFGRGGKTADFRHKKRMDKIEHQLDTRHREFSEIVRMFSARAFLHMPPSDRKWTDDEIEQAGRTYYGAYRDNAQQVLDLIDKAQQRLNVAIDEENDSPDYAALAAQWQTDAVPGRAAVWCYRHPAHAAALPQSARDAFDALNAEYEQILAHRDTAHARKMRAEATLAPVRSKLQTLFKERNDEELTNLAAQLAQLDGAEATQLHQLAQAYLAELGGDSEQAFANYAKLIDLVRDELATRSDTGTNPRLEDALRRMVVIAMAGEDYEQALLILETLSGMSPAYQPQFAELLRLCGDTEAAVSVYSDYLGKVPGDHVAMLRLGKLYHNIGAVDAARTAFSYILEREPDNEAARTLLREIDTAA